MITSNKARELMRTHVDRALDVAFYHIESRAKNGHDSMLLGGNFWMQDNDFRNEAQRQLEKLGFEVTYITKSNNESAPGTLVRW